MNILTISVCVALSGFLLTGCEKDEAFTPGNTYTGINLLDTVLAEQVDKILSEYGAQYRYISLGIIQEGKPVLIRCYGQNRLGREDEYASVTKPVTAMITLNLLEKGLIRSLDDPIGLYCSKYRDVLPDAYPDVPITFTHLMSHQSGIPHHDRIWKDGKLNLAFEPGTQMMYSTRGYGVLGDVISMIGGKSFNQLVRETIGEPVSAHSISCPLPFFEAPGGLVQSTISDMARFACGVINGAYVSDSLLFQRVWVPLGSDASGEMGLGWYVARYGTRDLAVYHAGSNGKPRAFMVLKPLKGMGVVLLGEREQSDGSQLFPEIATRLVTLLDQSDLAD
jgi:CubicO group peptidase (beta-lactamase class C family)